MIISRYARTKFEWDVHNQDFSQVTANFGHDIRRQIRSQSKQAKLVAQKAVSGQNKNGKPDMDFLFAAKKASRRCIRLGDT